MNPHPEVWARALSATLTAQQNENRRYTSNIHRRMMASTVDTRELGFAPKPSPLAAAMAALWDVAANAAIREKIRADAHSHFDEWERAVLADDQALMEVETNQAGAIGRFCELIENQAAEHLKYGETVLAAIYAHETKTVTKERFQRFIAQRIADLEAELDREDPAKLWSRTAHLATGEDGDGRH